jgi:hypothetical protein
MPRAEMFRKKRAGLSFAEMFRRERPGSYKEKI